ncbi:hypothetical protein V8F33_005532 [Rhypophila sp. PSN 637]
MPPKRNQKGYIQSVYASLTAPENASVVRSIALFGGAVALISSSWADALIGNHTLYPTIRNSTAGDGGYTCIISAKDLLYDTSLDEVAGRSDAPHDDLAHNDDGVCPTVPGLTCSLECGIYVGTGRVEDEPLETERLLASGPHIVQTIIFLVALGSPLVERVDTRACSTTPGYRLECLLVDPEDDRAQNYLFYKRGHVQLRRYCVPAVVFDGTEKLSEAHHRFTSNR